MPGTGAGSVTLDNEVDQATAGASGDARPLSAARRRLRVLGLAGVLLILGLSTGHAWQSRQQLIDSASTTAQRRVEQLAATLDQALALGDALIRQTDARLQGLAPGRAVDDALAALARERQPLLDALDIPLALQAHDAQGQLIGAPAAAGARAVRIAASAAGWQAETPDGQVAGPGRLLSLVRAAAPNPLGLSAYSLALQHAPLVKRFEAVRLQPGGGVSLFHVEADGRGLTLLARAPDIDADLGRLVRGPLYQALQRQRVGWFDDQTQVDGLRRVVAYQRLGGAAESLVLGYGARTDDVLAGWRANLPWLALGTGALLLLWLLGLAWLDRTLQQSESAADALRQSEARLRTLADNLPDVVVRYDRALRHRLVNAAITRATGLRPDQVLGKTLAEAGMPGANVQAWTRTLERVFNTGRIERLDFAYPGPGGLRHWESLVVPEAGARGEVASALMISRDVTDRVQHAEAVARSELRFRLAASYGQVWEWDIAADGVHFPAVWWAGLGHAVPPAADAAQAFEAIVHPDDLPHWRQTLRAHLREKQPYEVTFRVATATGGWRWMQTQGQSTRDAQGRAVYMAGTTFDITERQQAVAALRESQKRLSDVLANSPAVIYTARPGGDYGSTYYTPNVQGLLGHAPEQFICDSGFWLNHVHPEDRYGVLSQLERLPALGHLVLEYRFQRSDGQWRWLHDEVRLTRDASGQPLEVIGSLVDVTDRHQAEDDVRALNAELEGRVQRRTAELQASERRLRAIFDTVPVALNEEDWSEVCRKLQALKDSGVEDGPAYFDAHPDLVRECFEAVRVLQLNQRSIALQQLPPALAGAAASLLPAMDGPAGRAAFTDELAALWGGQRLYTAKRSQTTADGQTLQLMLTMSLPALDGSSDGVALVCLVDITEIDRLNAELDASVDRLKRINRELETFTYSVSHDLKAPLRGIDGYSQLLLRDHAAALDEEARSFLARIRSATLQMGQLIDDLLTYSRLERRSLSLVALPLHELVQQVLADAAAVAQLLGAELHNEVPLELRALGDAQGLRMALRNLVDNALKFGRPGRPVQVVVGAERRVAPPGAAGAKGRSGTLLGDGVRLTVRDNGIGFDMKFRERIFGIFQRLHRAEQFPGTGVGLAIVRKAMDRMGGHVDAVSEPGQGAVFNLDLPVAR